MAPPGTPGSPRDKPPGTAHPGTSPQPPGSPSSQAHPGTPGDPHSWLLGAHRRPTGGATGLLREPPRAPEVARGQKIYTETPDQPPEMAATSSRNVMVSTRPGTLHLHTQLQPAPPPPCVRRVRLTHALVGPPPPRSVRNLTQSQKRSDTYLCDRDISLCATDTLCLCATGTAVSVPQRQLSLCHRHSCLCVAHTGGRAGGGRSCQLHPHWCPPHPPKIAIPRCGGLV